MSYGLVGWVPVVPGAAGVVVVAVCLGTQA
jgi:hypothetical protein